MALSAPGPLTESHDLSRFSSGKPSLDNWLRERALSNQRYGFSAVAVICDGDQVTGYYALSPTAVTPQALPRPIRTGQPPNPVPCILLGQLAVDQAWMGQGIGTGLLKHAFGRAVAAAELVGGRALLVNAVDEEALAFWQRRGFRPTKNDRFLLYRSMSDIARAVAGSR